MKYRIAISGSYGGMNLGDEAILETILKEIQASSLDVEVVVFSKNPADTEQRHKVRSIAIREIHKNELLEELEKLDLLILGGGGLLFDGRVDEYLRDVNWTRDLGIPVMVYAISVGPLQAPESKKLVVETLNRVDKITVREGEAKRVLHDLGVNQDIEVTADPALLLKPQAFTKEMLKKEGVDPEIPLVGFSVREPGPAAPELDVEQYHAILANAADFMVERFDAQILFVPMERGENRDPQHSHAVISKMANAQRASVLKGDYTSAQVLGLMGHMSFCVGMRLHFLIFSGIQRVPFVPLPYAAKVSGFLADLDMPMPTIGRLNVGKLCAFLDRSWDTRKQLAKKLEEKVPPLQERAKRTNQILCELLKTSPPRRDAS
ncbi:MAG TPA: polysaccharide pyruvyl transferase family protein [Candidatus Polarisedimenticolia bacterium]|nr:polysaccharide pyruvyl transferase family protein [Candidatus Polarisedimenticolia bacterium]